MSMTRSWLRTIRDAEINYAQLSRDVVREAARRLRWRLRQSIHPHAFFAVLIEAALQELDAREGGSDPPPEGPPQ